MPKAAATESSPALSSKSSRPDWESRSRVLATDGSLENLLMLRAGKADFAFYQPGTTEILRTYDPDLVSAAEQAAGLESTSAGRDEIACVANLYMQPAHFIVRADAHIERAGDLNRRPVSVGLTHSGDYAMSLLLLEHLGLGMESIDPRHLSFDEIVTAMVDDSLDEGDRLDATCHTVGSPAPFLQPLFESGKCQLFEIPHAKALTLNHVFLSEYTIPAGLYDSQPVARPPQDVSTVAVPAQLLTRTNVSSRVIEEVTNIVLDKRFARQNDLRELLERGEEFARSKPEFSIHPAAQSLYNPEFDIHLIESWEAAYSLTASLVIAGFFGFRAIRRNSERKVEHRLDRYIRALLEIEQRQVSLDQHVAVDDMHRLQELLDEVTVLRRNALREFSIHELNEDRGADCFLEMCHGLSNKINAKISRQRFDAAIHRLDRRHGRPLACESAVQVPRDTIGRALRQTECLGKMGDLDRRGRLLSFSTYSESAGVAGLCRENRSSRCTSLANASDGWAW